MAGPVLAIATSAEVTTLFDAVAMLLPPLLSEVSLVTLAVLLAVASAGVLALTWAVMMKVWVAPGPNGPVAVKVVVLPVVDGVNVPSPMSVEDWNVSLADRVSVSTTAWASLGPLLVSETV